MTRSPDLPLLAAVAAGGASGAVARYLLTSFWPQPGGVTILAVNVLGCFLMGVLVAAMGPTTPRLVRPFLGTGVLGGFTTVSTYAATSVLMLQDDPGAAVAYLLVTPCAAVAAAAAGSTCARLLRGSR